MSNQQKSFFSGGRQASGAAYRSADGPISQAVGDVVAVVTSVLWVIRKLVGILGKWSVLLKYQFYKRTAIPPSRIRLPWLKLGFLGLLGIAATRQDLSFSIGLGGADHVRFGGTALAEDISLKEGMGKEGLLGFFGEKKVDYFADRAEDDVKDRRIKAYIRRFRKVAIAEKERYGIPASIKMAQAIVESNSGQSKLAMDNNNHFGVKCFSRTCKRGHCSNFGDDSHKDFFRKYDSAWESWRAHSEMIAEGRYKSLLKYGDDYRKWAKGLKKLGYATAGHYEQTLINLIERYHLDELDR